MSKITAIFFIIIAFVVAFIFVSLMSILGIYNGINRLDEESNKSWAKVQSQYQRRMDLIPNLVSVVEANAQFEKSTLKEVAEARASVGKATIDISNATPQQLAAFQQAHTGLSAALSKLMVVSEQYPTLRANDNFLALTAELAGSENRVAVARNDFNTAVGAYNAYIRGAPNSFIANFIGMHSRPYFQSDAGAEAAPKVKFNTK